MPKGSLLKLYLPKEVIKVVNNRDFFAKGIFQKPEFASCLLNTVALVNYARVSSTLGMGCVSLMTPLLSGLRSMQILTFPDFFGTTTIPAHQGVDSDTVVITPIDSIRSSSSFTFFLIGIGTFQGV